VDGFTDPGPVDVPVMTWSSIISVTGRQPSLKLP